MPKSKRGFGLDTFTLQGQKKRFDYKSKRIRGDDGGNDTLDLNGVRDDGGRTYGLSGEITKTRVT